MDKTLVKKPEIAVEDSKKSIKVNDLRLGKNNSEQLSFFKKINYELYFFIALLFLASFSFTKVRADRVYDVYFNTFIFDYSIGFAPRLFIGSVMSLFTDFKSVRFMTGFMHISHLLSYLIYSFVAGRLIRKAADDVRESVIYLIILFLVNPFSFSAISYRAISVDHFTLVFTLLMLMVLTKSYFRWSVPLLIFVALATYMQYAFLFMPIIAILLLYELGKSDYSKKNIGLSIISFATMAFFSGYFYLFSGLKNYGNRNELLEYAGKMSDLIFDDFAKNVIHDYFLTSPFERFRFFSAADPNLVQKLKLDVIAKDIPYFIYALPLFVFFVFVWKDAIKRAGKKFEKFIFALCMLAPLFRLPLLFLMTPDIIRAWIAVVTGQFFLLFFFVFRKDPFVLESVRRARDFLKRHYLMSLLLLGFYAISFLAFRSFRAWNVFVGTYHEALY